jgi:hypothetical protein
VLDRIIYGTFIQVNLTSLIFVLRILDFLLGLRELCGHHETQRNLT